MILLKESLRLMSSKIELHSHLIGREKVIREFIKVVDPLIGRIYDSCVKNDDEFDKNKYKEIIIRSIWTICNQKTDVMAIYEWIGLPKFELLQKQFAMPTFYDFFSTYRSMDGGLRIVNKIISDLKVVDVMSKI